MSSRSRSESDEQELIALMKRAQNGDKDAYKAFLLRLETIASAYVRSALWRTGSSWEDIVQDILIAVHTKRHTYQTERPFYPWFFAIARFKLIDHLRRNRRERVATQEELELLESVSTMDPEEPLVSRDLEDLMRSLSAKQRAALRMVKIEGLSIAEAAAQLGIGVSDVKVSIHRALHKLKKEISENESL